jgi:hypothetical protein
MEEFHGGETKKQGATTPSTATETAA